MSGSVCSYRALTDYYRHHLVPHRSYRMHRLNAYVCANGKGGEAYRRAPPMVPRSHATPPIFMCAVLLVQLLGFVSLQQSCSTSDNNGYSPLKRVSLSVSTTCMPCEQSSYVASHPSMVRLIQDFGSCCHSHRPKLRRHIPRNPEATDTLQVSPVSSDSSWSIPMATALVFVFQVWLIGPTGRSDTDVDGAF